MKKVKCHVYLTCQFFNHFHEQNGKIESGELDGVALDFQSLGIINGIIDESIQVLTTLIYHCLNLLIHSRLLTILSSRPRTLMVSNL